jgi:hypothetical protein
MTSPAFCSLNSGADYSLSGLSDIKLGGHYLILNDKYLVTFGMNLPTGKSALVDDETPVANTLVIPAFRFRLPTLGQGFDMQLGISSAWELGEFMVGAGVSYLMKGGFKPFKGYDESYNPGDELSFTVGVDKTVRLFQRDMRIIGDVLYSMYFDDTWEGEKVFSSGNRFTIQLASSFKVNSLDMIVFIREQTKGKNTTGSGDIYKSERKNSNGNQFEIQTYGYYPYKPNTRLKGVVDVKFYSDNEYETGGATLFGLGGGGQFRLTPQMVFDGDVRFYFGSIKSGAEGTGVFGLKVFGGIQYTF